MLAEEAPADADVVIPVPDSGIMAAVGYSEKSGIPYGEGLIKNRYVGRTFIEPADGMRQLGIRLKLNPLPSVIEGKARRGDRRLHRAGQHEPQAGRVALYEAGATEVHFRVSSPPVTGPCYYGIDMDSPDQLVGANYTDRGDTRADRGHHPGLPLHRCDGGKATEQPKDLPLPRLL